ncbi:MAG: NrfD/PsrC family molybdoenzyme membrane anchor subunit [Candidatus Xenobia bacterium]
MISDGRFIDAKLGTLSGEAAQQPMAYQLAQAQTVLKPPVWKPTVPLYFYVGGITGAAAVLAAACLASPDLHPLSRRLRWISQAGSLVSAVLLIDDLGRPERFLNMLRVFRPTSPMSLGSWALAGVGAFSLPAAVLDGPAGNAFTLANAACGAFLASYTAVLLSNTAVPFWIAARYWLPPLFVGSAMASLEALLQLFPLSEREHRVVGTFGRVGQILELGAGSALDGKPSLRRGLARDLWRAARLCTAGAALVALSPRHRRMAAGLATAGALATRFAVFYAGVASTKG